MTGHTTLPGTDVPGAPGSGGQEAGAGGLAPGQEPVQEVKLSELLRARKKEELKKLRGELENSCKPFIKANPDTYFAYRVYNSLIFGERVRKRLAVIAEVLKLPEEKVISYANRNVEGFKVRSVQRVIETCEKMKTMKLVDFHYNFEKIAKTLFDIWWSIWEDRDEREKMKKFGETFKTMTVEQLLASWDNVKHELMLIEKKYNRRGALVPAMKSAFKEQTHLRTALVSELKTILMERLGAEEDNVNTLLQDLPMLLYLEYSNRDY